MKKHFVLLVIALFYTSLNYAQQQKIVFSYDNAGNQTRRDMVCVTCREALQKTVVDSTAIVKEVKTEETEDNLTKSNTKITAYPNPVTNILHVAWTPTNNKVKQLMLYTMDNRQVFQKTIIQDAFGGIDIDFSAYPLGSYILIAVYTDNSTKSFQIVKK